MSRQGWTLALLPVALLALVSASVLAETDVYASGVVQWEYLYNMNDDIESSVSDARVDLDMGVGPLTLGVVYRAYQLSDPAYNPAGKDIPEAVVKHRYIAFEDEDISLRAGHFFATFGRGLTLRSYENADLEHDTVLDGIIAEYDAGALGLTALAGTTKEDESRTRYHTHVVRGARAAMPLGEWFEIAGSVVERSSILEDEGAAVHPDFARFEDGVRGAEVSGWIGPFTFGGEYADRRGEYPEAAKKVDSGTGEPVYPRAQVEKRGHATYASGTVDLGWATLFGEFKEFDDFAHSLVNPPTCVREHLWTLMNRATYEVDLNDERGFLVEGSSTLGDAFFVTGGASEARSHNRDLRHWEMFGHATYDVGSDVTLGAAASRSREYLFGAEGGTGKFTEHTTGVAEVDFTIASDQTVELTLEMQRTEAPTFEGVQKDYLASFAWYPGADLTISGVYEKTTADWEEREAWTMLSVRKSFDNDLEAEFAAGTERGGKKCAGGICRYEPEFEGVRFRLTKFF